MSQISEERLEKLERPFSTRLANNAVGGQARWGCLAEALAESPEGGAPGTIIPKLAKRERQTHSLSSARSFLILRHTQSLFFRRKIFTRAGAGARGG